MYQIEAPTGKTLNDYYKDYHQCIIDGVDYFLAGNTVPWSWATISRSS